MAEAAHFISSLGTLTHLKRWKAVTVIFEVNNMSVSERTLGVLNVKPCMRTRWLEHEMLHNERGNRLWGRRLGPLLGTVGHSQRARLNNWSMSVQWKQKHSLALYFPSPPVMCIESHRSISYMQSSAELKDLQVHFNYSASLQDYELLSQKYVPYTATRCSSLSTSPTS